MLAMLWNHRRVWEAAYIQPVMRQAHRALKQASDRAGAGIRDRRLHPRQWFDALIVGFYQKKELLFAPRVRPGFIPATRRETFAKIKHLKTSKCPFANLPDSSPGRWGQGLTAEKMKGCIWLKPETVVRIDFAEWTGANKPRHIKFVALRDDKDPKKVVREEN